MQIMNHFTIFCLVACIVLFSFWFILPIAPYANVRSTTATDVNGSIYVSPLHNISLLSLPRPTVATPLISTNDRIVFTIGDLHGDLGCAIAAVELTGLVVGDLTRMSHRWTWTDLTAKIVFVGDYIDRGPQSKGVLELVMTLQVRFPNHVIALLGNHEIEALLDRDRVRDRRQLVVHYPSSYVNLYELQNWVPHDTIIDETRDAVGAIYRALLDRVYGESRSYVTISPNGPNSIVDLVEPKSFRPIVRRELERLQQAYIDGFSGEIGKWLEQMPITHTSDDGKLLFVHGGIDPEHFARGRALSGGRRALVALNEQFRQNSRKESLAKFIQSNAGEVVYDLLTYRGNHGNCRSIDAIKAATGASHVIVGHTPDTTVRIRCQNSFLAVDSMISRWIRTAGNNYCKGTERAVSGNGRFACGVVGKCMGEIVKMTKTDDGWVSGVIAL